MTRYLVIDTETTGLFDFSKGAHEEGQPRLAHLGMIFIEADGTERERDIYIKPDGWIMPAEVTKINGLTMEKLETDGVPVAIALAVYTDAIDAGYVIVAFNAQYDTKVMRGELRRADIDDRFTRTPNICVMRPCTNICKILKNDPRTDDDWKFPKLSEALAFFQITQDGAHTAVGDTRGAREIMRKLIELNALPEPAVHFAKRQPGDAPAAKPKRASKPAIETDENGIPK